MSDKNLRLRDRGMTLIELLLSVSLTGIVVLSLTMATIVVLKTKDNTMGRSNNARSEQNVGLWMPADLASAEDVDQSVGALPCPSGVACPADANIGGSNAITLHWRGSVIQNGLAVATDTYVSYRVLEVNGEFQLVRVECEWTGGNANCSRLIVLHDLQPPPPGTEWHPGVTPPSWIITVSNALSAADTHLAGEAVSADPTLDRKNGQRVVVTINGGGNINGKGGGEKLFSLSAGGTDRKTSLTTNDLTGAPSFTAARSRCGGNFAMLVDTSGSITSAQMTAVKSGLANFIDAFAGTPVKLEIVTFNTTSSTLGAASGEWSKYYDMLNDGDVSTMKGLAAGSALTSGGYTNWEDGFFRILKNSDGTTQASLPSTILFFTDGVPTKSRLEASSAAGLGSADPLDAGLGGPSGGNFYQVGWNRAERLIRDRGSINLVGVFVGSSTANSLWSTAGPGYHLGYQVGNTVNYQRGYHGDYSVGNGVTFQRGYHAGYEVGSAVVYQQGFHPTYERNNNVVYQISGTGLTYQQKISGTWTNIAKSLYLSNNTTNDSTDNYKIVFSGGLGSWGTVTQAQYEASNVTSGSTDGLRTSVGSLSSSWTEVTLAQYNATNTTTDSTDGWRTTSAYSSPYTSWSNTTKALYDAGNTVSSNSDGWQTIVSGSNTTWTEVTSAQYNASNTTTDSADGWRAGSVYAAPYSVWEASNLAAYLAGNTTSSNSDGWQNTVAGTNTIWTTVTSAQYNASNTTTDSADGWQTTNVYTAPYSSWELSTKAAYEAVGANTTSSNSDGWQTTVSGSITGWTDVTKAQYDASNTTTTSTDGWQTVNVYSPPYDLHDGATSTSIKDYATLGNITVSNTSGIAGNFVEALPRGGPYTNAAAADLFILPDYTNFSAALSTIALGQCGGTVTMQTKIGSSAAQDPFTYENATTHEVVQTSAAYRSGTFDIALPGGAPQTVTFSPQDLTSLSRYSPAGWTCKSGGVAFPFTVAPLVGHAPWTSITLTVTANQAVSCIQNVTFT